MFERVDEDGNTLGFAILNVDDRRARDPLRREFGSLRRRAPQEIFTRNLYVYYIRSSDRDSIPVSLPPEATRRLDELVERGVFGSRSEALRYGARLVIREESVPRRLHELTDRRAREDVRERLERKRVP